MADGALSSTEINTGTGPEAGRSPEVKKDTRDQVKEALNKALDSLRQEASNPTSSDQLKLALKSVEDAKKGSLDDPAGEKDTYTVWLHEDDPAKKKAQEEGIPVEDLLKHIKDKINSTPKDTPEGKSARREWHRIGRILYRNSQRYSEAHNMAGDDYIGRVRVEAKYISGDDNRRSKEAADEDRMKANYYQAEDVLIGTDRDKQKYKSERAWFRSARALNRRLELQIPPRDEATTATTPPIVEVPPVPVTEAPPAPTTTDPVPDSRPTREITPIIGGAGPTPPEVIKKDITIVNATEYVRKKAAEIATEHIRQEMRRGSWWQVWHWPRKVGLRVAEEYHRQVNTARAVEAMKSGNFNLLKSDFIKNAAQEAMQRLKNGEAKATVSMVKENIKEGTQLAGESTEIATRSLKEKMLNGIIRPMVKGELSDDQKIQENLTQFVKDIKDDPQLARIFGVDATKFGAMAEYFASDLKDIAQQIKADIEAHRSAISLMGPVQDLPDFIDANLANFVGNINLANTSWAAESDAHFNRVDKLVAWAQKGRARGWLLNPATIGAAASVATFFGGRALGWSARAVGIATPVVGSLVGAGLAAARRNKDLQRDIATHRVERAYNKEVPVGAKRREALEQYTYQTASVDDLLKGKGSPPQGGLESLLKLPLLDGQDTNRQLVIDRIAEIQARVDFSFNHKVDLVTYQSEGTVQQGRMELSREMARARQQLKAAGMDPDEITNLTKAAVARWNTQFTQNREQQDKAFRGYRVRQSLKAGAFAGVAGLVGGVLFQEGATFLARNIEGLDTAPIVGGIFNKGNTVRENIMAGKNASEWWDPSRAAGFAKDTAKELYSNPNRSIVLNPDLHMNVTPDYRVSFSDASGKPFVGFEASLKADGSFVVQDKTPADLPEPVRQFFGQADWKSENVVDKGLGGLRGINIELALDLYNNPRSLEVASGIFIDAQDDHSVLFKDAGGNIIPTPKIEIASDGVLKIQGKIDNLPDNLKSLLSGPDWKSKLIEDPRVNIEDIKALYSKSTEIKTPEGYILRSGSVSGPDELHMIKIIDPMGREATSLPIRITDQGKVIVSGGLPPELQTMLKNNGIDLAPTTNPEYNLVNKIQETITRGEKAVVRHGNTIISLNGSDKTFSILDFPTQKEVHGILRDGALVIDPKTPGNTPDAITALKSRLDLEAWGVKDETIPGTKTSTLNDLAKERGFDIEKALRELWHDNDTPIRRLPDGRIVGADGKELQFHHRVIEGPNGKKLIQLDFSQMKSQLIPGTNSGINWDKSIDSQYNRLARDIIQNPDGSSKFANFELLFTADKAADDLREVIAINSKTHPELAQGLVNLEIDSKEAKAFFNLNPDGTPVYNEYKNFQKVAFIEVAHDEKDAAGNILKRTILSTTQGPGKPELPPPTPDTSIIKLSPPPATELTPQPDPLKTELTPGKPPVDSQFTPPEPKFDEASPMIPIPFAPRYAPEGMKEPKPPPPPPPPPPVSEYFGYPPEYGFGYPMTGEDSVNKYMDWLRKIGFYPQEAPYVRSPDGKWVNADGSEITRDPNRERRAIQSYLQRQNPGHLRMVESYAGVLPVMDPECRVSVTIPAFNEGKNIYRTLQEWANQADKDGNPIEKKRYEINIIINGPTGYTKDNTAQEVARFKKDHPDTRVNVIDMDIPYEGGNVGLARKIMSDITLQRSINRPTQAGSLYIESEDADLMEIDKRVIDRLIQKFDAEPQLDALRGKQDLTPTILMENDHLFFDLRVDRFVEYLLRDSRLKPEVNEDYDFYWNRNITGGWNTAYTAEAYALIGGYQSATIGEDVDIGRRISVMRGSKSGSGVFIPNVNVIDTVPNVGQSNPRRFILSLIKKIPAYSKFTDKQFNEEMRSRDLNEMMNELNFGKRIDPANLQNFEKKISEARTFLGWKIKDPAMREKMFSRLMLAMGFKKYKEVTNPDGSVTRENGNLNETGPEWKLDYHIEPDGKIKIDNLENIKAAFESYRANPKARSNSSSSTTPTP